MDPDATLKTVLDLIDEMCDLDDEADNHEFVGKAHELAAYVNELDFWLSRGGFLPKRWTTKET